MITGIDRLVLLPITFQLLRCCSYELAERLLDHRPVALRALLVCQALFQTKIPMPSSRIGPSDCKTRWARVSDCDFLLSFQ